MVKTMKQSVCRLRYLGEVRLSRPCWGWSMESSHRASTRAGATRRVSLLSLVGAPGLLEQLLVETVPEVGNCPTCLGPVDSTLGSCSGLPTCLSTYDDRPAHFVGPWEYSGSKDQALGRLLRVIQQVGGQMETQEGDYLHATFRGPWGTDDVEFLFAGVEDTTVALRAVPRMRAVPDFGRNATRLEDIRQLLGWDQVPILRNRQRKLFFVESPWDSFGPVPPPDLGNINRLDLGSGAPEY